MHKAWDKNKQKLITPSEAIEGRYYFCPACNKEVTVRALGKYSKIMPYFAHLKNVADKDCENYFPSDTNYLPDNWGKTYIKDNVPKNYLPRASFSKCLYLNYQTSWQLILSLTILPTFNRWEGYIDIESTSGTKRIKYDKQVQRLDVDLKFDFSLKSISKNGNVDDELWRSIVDNFDDINPIGGVFIAPFGTGKKLFEGENLRIGETYVFIPSREFHFNSTLKLLSELVVTLENANLYQFTIDERLTEEEIKNIETAFGVNVVDNKPDLKALNLYPLRVTSDGTYIIANNAKELIFKYQNRNAIEFKLINGIIDRNIEYLDDTIKVNIAQSDGVEIYWNRYPIVRVLKGNAEFFNPVGITVELDNKEFNLLDNNLNLQIENCQTLKFVSNYLDIKNLINYRPLKYSNNNNFSDSINLREDFELNAKAFGYIYFNHVSFKKDRSNLPSKVLNSRWLIFSGQFSKNVKEINNTLSFLEQINNKLNGQGTFHLMKLKNSNKIS